MKDQQEYSIHKAAGIIIRDRKVLTTRTKDKDIFINPGGKLEPGETVIEALIRELDEELGLTITEGDAEKMGTYYSEAAYAPGEWLRLDAFLVNNWQGEISPAAEVEEIRWIDSSDIGSIKLASIFEHDIVPELTKKGLID